MLFGFLFYLFVCFFGLFGVFCIVPFCFSFACDDSANDALERMCASLRQT